MTLDQAIAGVQSVDGPMPDSPVGRQLQWYVEAPRTGTVSDAEIEEHFVPGFAWPWGDSPRDEQQRLMWVSKWANGMRVDSVTPISDFEALVDFRMGRGPARSLLVVQVEDAPPHRLVAMNYGRPTPPPGAPHDFGEATALSGESGSGVYTGELSPTFETGMGPFGGYLAAVALRAAGMQTSKPAPAKFTCHFVNAARTGPVDARVSTLRASSRLEAIKIELHQGDKLLIDALVWAASSALSGPEHYLETIEDVPRPDSLRSFEELWTDFFPAFYGAMDAKPLLDGWQPDGEPPWTPQQRMALGSLPPKLAGWSRLNPTARFDDPWIDAARVLMPFDMMSANAIATPHRNSWFQLISLDMSLDFYNLDRASDWQFLRAESLIASGGRASASATAWSEGGDLVAVASQQMLVRSA